MTDFPPFHNPPALAAQYAWLTQRLLAVSEWAVDGLSAEQLNDTFAGKTNSVGFDVWHIVRTVDNITHFVFEREQPVWLRDGFDHRWDLPRVAQGTGQPSEDAYALHFPGPGEFKRYIGAVAAAVVPRIGAMSDAYLATPVFINPWGD
ncbi:MAG: DinB family protein, partial [Dehalococcoidia bacterium]